MAVVLDHQRLRARRGSLVAGVPAPLRSGAHVSTAQADLGLDRSEDPHPAGARPLAQDLRRPWEKPAPPSRLTPARVRRGFRNIRPTTALPARAPKPTRPGPGRPLGSHNRQPAPRYDVGKTVKRDTTSTAHQKR